MEIKCKHKQTQNENTVTVISNCCRLQLRNKNNAKKIQLQKQ